MTLNDIYLNERCLELRKVADELNLHMRDGDRDALARKLSRLAKISDEAIVRLHDMIHYQR